MFETLDEDMLGELLKLESLPRLNKETRLADLLACLEQVAAECRSPEAVKGFPAGCADQAAAGINAAQRIVEKLWNESASG